MTVEVNPEWLTVRDIPAWTIMDLDAVLEATGPGTPRLQEDVTTSNTMAFFKTTIATPYLVTPVFGFTLPDPNKRVEFDHRKGDILGDAGIHPTTYEVCNLVEETTYVGARI